MTARNDARAFIGSYTNSGGRGIVVADVGAGSGALVERSVTDAVPDPSYLTLNADASVLYAVSETDRGLAAAFATGGAGSRELTGLGEPVALGAATPAHLTLVGGRLLTANYGSGSLTSLPVERDGSLGPDRHVHPQRGGGPRTDRQEGSHVHQVLPDPSGRWIVSVDLGADAVRVHLLDPGTGELRPHGETVLRRGVGPRHLAFNPDGRHAYVLHELVPSLTVFRWDAEAGALEVLGECPLLPEAVPYESNASAIVAAPDGRFVWAANRVHDTISVIALADGGEKAALVANVPCGGHWPRDLALDPAGRRLYAANERAHNVTWFDIDPETGVPEQAGRVEIPAPTCVVFG